ncbi:MAG: hypothetical protein IPM84_10220 [Anaerolineae bacterium]|nr:hypothetical protein [Anaerolineae bacterium]
MSDQVNRLKAMVIFAWKVRQGGEWDPKPKLVAKFGDVPTTYENRLQEGGPAYYYDVWGNIEYGYLGTASAFSGMHCSKARAPNKSGAASVIR